MNSTVSVALDPVDSYRRWVSGLSAFWTQTLTKHFQGKKKKKAPRHLPAGSIVIVQDGGSTATVDPTSSEASASASTVIQAIDGLRVVVPVLVLVLIPGSSRHVGRER
jgi:hypothetical protein